MDIRQELKIIFFGTSEFGAIILEKMIQENLKPVLVVTTPDKPAGRKQALTPPPVKISAQKHSLEILQPEDFRHSSLDIRNLQADLFVVAAYGKILPKEILDIPRFGALNVHPSLLPKYRGPSPVQTALLNGEKETGVTIIQMDEKVDHGPILAQQEFKISNDQFLMSKPTYSQLHDKLAELGAELLIKTIPQWVEGNIRPQAQDESQATYTKIFKREDGRINWQHSADQIERQVRALNPWPGTYAYINDQILMTNDQLTPKTLKSLKILKAYVLQQETAGRKPGAMFLTREKKLAIKTGENALLVEELQPEGKRPMSAREFLLGYRDFIGKVLQ